ncbi:MAG: glycosyltransferase family 2 protein [Geobacteraceae bacterium]|nr:glycosyltransferase family 2 protein [Geobacteraceae bacterium]NTW80186.1 glycosyltransferase family 2 protein [Geobacteraceae bacterium]
MPVYNEKATIREILDCVKSVDIDKEIILVDDFSHDGTRDILSQIRDESIKIFYHGQNRGKGAALRTGISKCSGDIIIIQDADLEYDPNDYHKMIAPIISGKADVVYGSRFMGDQAHRVVFFWHRVGNGFLTFFSNMLTNLNLTDMETGYKAFRREIIQSIEIKENRFGFEPEITAKISKMKCRIYEVGISYYGRTYEEGKKIGWKDGFSAIWSIFKYNVLNK